MRGFNGSFLIASPETGNAVERYWPGFALLLAPFEYLKVPWLCNASLSGLALYLIHWITREITGDRRAAGWAVVFTLASGAFAADAISYYSMQAHLTANLLFVALLMKPTRYRALGAGLVGSLALILHNPFPHALFAAPWIAAMALAPGRRRYLLPLSLGYLPGLGIGLGWLVFRSGFASLPHAMSVVTGAADVVLSMAGLRRPWAARALPRCLPLRRRSCLRRDQAQLAGCGQANTAPSAISDVWVMTEKRVVIQVPRVKHFVLVQDPDPNLCPPNVADR